MFLNFLCSHCNLQSPFWMFGNWFSPNCSAGIWQTKLTPELLEQNLFYASIWSTNSLLIDLLYCLDVRSIHLFEINSNLWSIKAVSSNLADPLFVIEIWVYCNDFFIETKLYLICLNDFGWKQLIRINLNVLNKNNILNAYLECMKNQSPSRWVEGSIPSWLFNLWNGSDELSFFLNYIITFSIIIIAH